MKQKISSCLLDTRRGKNRISYSHEKNHCFCRLPLKMLIWENILFWKLFFVRLISSAHETQEHGGTFCCETHNKNVSFAVCFSVFLVFIHSLAATLWSLNTEKLNIKVLSYNFNFAVMKSYRTTKIWNLKIGRRNHNIKIVCFLDYFLLFIDFSLNFLDRKSVV